MTLEQKRAAKAFDDVHQFGEANKKDSPERKSYGTFALKLPALIKSAGLCQALYFLETRPPSKPMAKTLLGHLAGQLQRVDPTIQDADSLLKQVRSADLSSYLRLSRETLAVADWYSRLARSILKVQPGDEDAGGVGS